MKSFKEVQEAFGRRHDAYTRDYHSSVSGMGKHQSHAYHADGGANDEGWDREHHHKPADHPHSVHINGKKWKTFGSHSHASNVAKKIKGATVHKEETELDEAIDPSEIASNPKMYNSDAAKKAYYHKNATAEDKKSLERHLDRHHGNKEWRKSVKEEATCKVCKQDPCICDDDSHGFVKESEESDKHYKEAEEHLSKANDSDAKGDKKSFHAHMANHHDAMSEWHDSKGRSASADKHAEKADYHHEKSLSEQVIEARMSAAVKLQRAFQRQQEKSAASRKRGEELLNPKKDEPKKVSEGVKSPGVGWMIRQDPKLAAIIKVRKEKMKTFRQHVGKKIEDKDKD
jgi:hypothetical protein